MSLSDDLSSQTHWRRFVMHFCRTFPLYPHSYQDVGTDRLWWRIEWVYMMAYQANLLKKIHDASLQNLSIVSTFISRCGDRSTLMEQMSLSDGLSSQLIEEGLWRIFAEAFYCIHIHIKMWWSTLIEDRMSLSDGFSSQLIEEGLWHIFAEPFHCINIHIKIWWSDDSHGGLN